MYSFTVDDIQQRLGQFTVITTKSNKQVTGYLYTIDPQTHHVVLYQPQEKRVQLVMQPTIDTITMDSTTCLNIETMDTELNYKKENPYTPAWQQERKQQLVEYFRKNRIPIEFNENEPVIHVLGSARVESPYVATSVVCDNALIRKRVRDLILLFYNS